LSSTISFTNTNTLLKPFLLFQIRHDSSLDKFYRPRKVKHYPPPKPRDKTARYDGFLKAKRKRLRRNKTP
ncbi:779_t:CDS:2, partial [Funneliformis caledonium]